MSIWGLKEQANFESGRNCYCCGELIVEQSEGEKRLCEECYEEAKGELILNQPEKATAE